MKEILSVEGSDGGRSCLCLDSDPDMRKAYLPRWGAFDPDYATEVSLCLHSQRGAAFCQIGSGHSRIKTKRQNICLQK